MRTRFPRIHSLILLFIFLSSAQLITLLIATLSYPKSPKGLKWVEQSRTVSGLKENKTKCRLIHMFKAGWFPTNSKHRFQNQNSLPEPEKEL